MAGGADRRRRLCRSRRRAGRPHRHRTGPTAADLPPDRCQQGAHSGNDRYLRWPRSNLQPDWSGLPRGDLRGARRQRRCPVVGRALLVQRPALLDRRQSHLRTSGRWPPARCTDLDPAADGHAATAHLSDSHPVRAGPEFDGRTREHQPRLHASVRALRARRADAAAAGRFAQPVHQFLGARRQRRRDLQGRQRSAARVEHAPATHAGLPHHAHGNGADQLHPGSDSVAVAHTAAGADARAYQFWSGRDERRAQRSIADQPDQAIHLPGAGRPAVARAALVARRRGQLLAARRHRRCHLQALHESGARVQPHPAAHAGLPHLAERAGRDQLRAGIDRAAAGADAHADHAAGGARAHQLQAGRDQHHTQRQPAGQPDQAVCLPRPGRPADDHPAQLAGQRGQLCAARLLRRHHLQAVQQPGTRVQPHPATHARLPDLDQRPGLHRLPAGTDRAPVGTDAHADNAARRARTYQLCAG